MASGRAWGDRWRSRPSRGSGSSRAFHERCRGGSRRAPGCPGSRRPSGPRIAAADHRRGRRERGGCRRPARAGCGRPPHGSSGGQRRHGCRGRREPRAPPPGRSTTPWRLTSIRTMCRSSSPRASYWSWPGTSASSTGGDRRPGPGHDVWSSNGITTASDAQNGGVTFSHVVPRRWETPDAGEVPGAHLHGRARHRDAVGGELTGGPVEIELVPPGLGVAETVRVREQGIAGPGRELQVRRLGSTSARYTTGPPAGRSASRGMSRIRSTRISMPSTSRAALTTSSTSRHQCSPRRGERARRSARPRWCRAPA